MTLNNVSNVIERLHCWGRHYVSLL